jgi:hypothetical protein
MWASVEWSGGGRAQQLLFAAQTPGLSGLGLLATWHFNGNGGKPRHRCFPAQLPGLHLSCPALSIEPMAY